MVVNGHPESGKDTAVQFMARHLAGMGYSTHSVSSIDPVRNMLHDLGVPVEKKSPAERDLMAEVKAALEKYDWFATKHCAKQVKDWFWLFPTPLKVCFVHIREAAAIDKFRELMGDKKDTQVVTLLVDRPDAKRVTSNAADAGVENFAYDYVLQNYGTTEDLRTSCVIMVHKITETS